MRCLRVNSLPRGKRDIPRWFAVSILGITARPAPYSMNPMLRVRQSTYSRSIAISTGRPRFFYNSISPPAMPAPLEAGGRGRGGGGGLNVCTHIGRLNIVLRVEIANRPTATPRYTSHTSTTTYVCANVLINSVEWRRTCVNHSRTRTLLRVLHLI